MAQLRFAVRRTRTASERAGGKRWIAQAAFPGGRVIQYHRTRDRAQAVDAVQQQQTIATVAAITAAPADATVATSNGQRVFSPKLAAIREAQGLDDPVLE